MRTPSNYFDQLLAATRFFGLSAQFVCFCFCMACTANACLQAEEIEEFPAPDSLAPWESPAEPLPDDIVWGPEDESWPYASPWTWQVLPDGLIYRSYLAGPKEPRIAGIWVNQNDHGWLYDATLGGRVGLLRYGNNRSDRPEGWQLDLEVAAFPRLDFKNELDLVSSDFRFGMPLTYGSGPWSAKLAYYHLSSHLGDEFLLANPGVTRLNYSRDAMVAGVAYRPIDEVRIYGEAGWSFHNDGGSQPWEFQFGAEYSPLWAWALGGAPFAAVNAHLREEVDFGGELTVQAGYQWRGAQSGRLFRLGLQYLTGKSPQYEFFNQNEEQLGIGLWYDY